MVGMGRDSSSNNAERRSTRNLLTWVSVMVRRSMRSAPAQKAPGVVERIMRVRTLCGVRPLKGFGVRKTAAHLLSNLTLSKHSRSSWAMMRTLCRERGSCILTCNIRVEMAFLLCGLLRNRQATAGLDGTG